MKGIADSKEKKATDPCLGWLSCVTRDFPDGLFRGVRFAIRFRNTGEALAFAKKHDLDHPIIRDLPVDNSSIKKHVRETG